jgi:amidohydrolase
MSYNRFTINDLIAENLDSLIAFRREMHQHPEIAYTEYETAKRIVGFLETIPGITIYKGLAGGTGVLAKLELKPHDEHIHKKDFAREGSNQRGCIALRADIDALPIEEESGLPYASKNKGYMHACGHDGHTSCLLGAVKVLSALNGTDAVKRDTTVLFIFQPAEEGWGGAKKLCDEGILEEHNVCAIFGFHNWPYLEEGHIATAPGPLMASSDSIVITIEGKGSHAALPHLAKDPITAGSYLVTALQNIVSRFNDPMKSAVVSICEFYAGSSSNIIPDTAILKGTIRALDKDTREKAFEFCQRIAQSVALMFDVRIDVKFSKVGYPPVVNSKEEAEHVITVAESLLSKSHVNGCVSPVMTAEDFAFYLEKVPGAYWVLGTKRSEDEPQLHTSRYDFNDSIIPLAVKMKFRVKKHQYKN